MATSSTSLRILFTCVGRRVELLQAFRRAAERLKIELTIHGSDITLLAPAMHHVDKRHILPRLSDRSYIPKLLNVAKRHMIDIVIPTIDSELDLLAKSQDQFAPFGCRVVISSQAVIDICSDKVLTFNALKKAKIDTPATWTFDEIMQRKRHKFPYHMKPRAGSAGKGNFRIDDVDELRVLGRRVENPIVQEFVDGVEHTMDVYTGFDGVPRCAVPRKRLEVRTGEVSKAIVVKDRRVMDVGLAVARALGGCRGVVTVQCMVTKRGRMCVIEMNPRFGGGAPLAIEAGADFPRWLMAEHLGRRIKIGESFKDGLTMLRYDQSVFGKFRDK